jgi:golgi phosphoprotein 3
MLMLIQSEKLLLLALEEKKGNVTSFTIGSLRYGLAGALLADLAMQGKVRMAKNKLALVDATLTGDKILDEALGAIAADNEAHKVTRWIHTLGDRKISHRIIDQLAEKGVLQREDKHFMWVIPYQGTNQLNASAKYLVKQQLRAMVLADEKPDPNAVVLLSLLKACRLLNLVFTRDERKAANQRVGELVKGEDFGKAVARTIAEIEAATAAAAMAEAAG